MEDFKHEFLSSMLDSIKDKTLSIVQGNNQDYGARFANQLKEICTHKPSNLDQLLTWWPDDALCVYYYRQDDRKSRTALETGSAGQKAAAILAILLCHGDEPLIIDQPEDDLDNALIYDLIVTQIHESKKRRQVIIATHHPNIVVNGDSELVHIFKFHGGQICVDIEGGLEETPVREAICSIMEGGVNAFKKRYKRIILRANDV
jgi:predicted MPP superfamily phosphohydrolase